MSAADDGEPVLRHPKPRRHHFDGLLPAVADGVSGS